MIIRKIFFVAGSVIAGLFLINISVSAALVFQELDFPQPVSTENWKTYQNDIYKFEIKYPEHWADPWEEDISDTAIGQALKISFSSENLIGDKDTGGFLVFISQAGACDSAEACPSHKLRKLREAPSNYLYEASGQFYDYTLAPVIAENGFSLSSRENVASQFSAAMETFSFDSSFQPAPKKTRQSVKNNSERSTAFIGKISEILAETRKVNSRKVCAKKNDHPAPSKKNPKWQVDGECCLDPYEIPNASCHYPPEKYGNLIQKYLASQRK